MTMKFVPVIWKQVTRRRTRSLLTICGIAVSVFLFCGVEAMQKSTEAATRAEANETTLVVYRKNRFCPFTSRMPQRYEDKIATIPGVVGVVPMQITVSNCRTSLDVVTFRGVPEQAFRSEFLPKMELISGSVDAWAQRSDSVLLGETFANRRGLRVGDRFSAAGITVSVAGVVRSTEPQHQNVAYCHLPFIQSASGHRQGGFVTQFNVRVSDPSQMEPVAAAIDAAFAQDAEPTQTRSEKAFVLRAASDVVQIVGFTKWVGWGCLIAILALLANAIALAVQDRVRDHAVLQTLGFTSTLISTLIIGEGLLLSVAGGLLGTTLAGFVLWWSAFNLTVEGLSIPIQASSGLFATSLLVCALLGVVAGLAPAWRAGRQEIVACFRAE